MKKLIMILSIVTVLLFTTGCTLDETTSSDIQKQQAVSEKLEKAQPTPTDISYSLERYNLIRRAYWVNGEREKARTLPCPITLPLSKIALLSESGAVVAMLEVSGKVSSLNSMLSPESELYESDMNTGRVGDNKWIADTDGSYGVNDNGIFFFTADGKYIEWNGSYMYTDVPFTIANPVIKMEVK